MSRNRRSPDRASRGGRRPAEVTAPVTLRSPVVVAIAGALVVLTAIAFRGLAGADFIQLDDPVYVSENPDVAGGLTPRAIAWAFTTFANANWHPLTWLSHLTDVQLFGLSPGAHHVTNLVLHIVNTLLLFGLLAQMTQAVWRSALVAALFAVHPLHVESVAWISERKDVLSTCLWLLTMAAYVAYVNAPAPRRYALVAGLFALGLMAKPMLVTLPFVLLLLDVWPLRRATVPWAAALVKEKIPLFVLSAASSVITVIAQQRGGAVMSLETVPFLARVENAIVSCATYLANTIWPVDLAMFYPHRALPPPAILAISAVVLLGITATVLWVLRRNPAPAVGWFWYLGTLVPVIGLVQVGRQALADRYTYVPLIGVFLAIAWAVPSSVFSRRPALRAAAALIGVACVVACATVTTAQVRHWQTNAAVWERALSVTLDVDTERARIAVAAVTKDARHVNEAIAGYFQVDRVSGRQLLAATLVAQGHPLEALATLHEVIAEQPDLAPAQANLGRIYGQLGKFDRAAGHLGAAVKLHPDDARARSDYGLALANLGQLDDALAQYAEALKIDPALPELRNNLGIALASKERIEDAIVQFREAVRLKPDYVEALRNLGVGYLRLGKGPEAAAAFSEVLRLKPGDDTATKGLALVIRR